MQLNEQSKGIRGPDKADNTHVAKKKDNASDPIRNELAPVERKAGLRCPGGCGR